MLANLFTKVNNLAREVGLTIKQLNTKIDNLSVGGTNLLNNTLTFSEPWRKASRDNKSTWTLTDNVLRVVGVTPVSWKHVGYMIEKQKAIELVTRDTKFTLSVYVRKISGSSGTLNIAIRKGLISGGYDDRNSQKEFNIGAEWQKCTVSGTITLTDLKYLYPRFEWKHEATYEFKLPKLEFGSISTDWSESPEDRLGWKTITSKIDLNTLTKPGKYFIATSEKTNTPVRSWQYVEVEGLTVAGKERLVQTIRADNDAGQYYFRLKTDSSWRPWQKVPTDNAEDLKRGILHPDRLRGLYRDMTFDLNSDNTIYKSQSQGSPSRAYTILNAAQYSEQGIVNKYVFFKTPIKKGQEVSLRFDIKGTVGKPIKDIIDSEVCVYTTGSAINNQLNFLRARSGIILDMSVAYVEGFLCFIISGKERTLDTPNISVSDVNVSDVKDINYLKGWAVSTSNILTSTESLHKLPLKQEIVSSAPVYAKGIQFYENMKPVKMKTLTGTLKRTRTVVPHGVGKGNVRGVHIVVRDTNEDTYIVAGGDQENVIFYVVEGDNIVLSTQGNDLTNREYFLTIIHE